MRSRYSGVRAIGVSMVTLVFSMAVLPSAVKPGDPTAIAPETVRAWSAPYRGWHYQPNHVIPAAPGIKGFEDVTMTDVPTVFQVPGDKNWYMSFYMYYNAVGEQGRGIGLITSKPISE